MIPIRIIVALLATLMFGAADARSVPQPGPNDFRIRLVPYKEMEVFEVVGMVGRMVRITLDDGEVIQSVRFPPGGENLWSVNWWKNTAGLGRKNILELTPGPKPGEDPAMNLFIDTSERSYALKVRCPKSQKKERAYSCEPTIPEPSELMYQVFFTYPNSLATVSALDPCPGPRNDKYEGQSDDASRAAIAPNDMWDNGTFTCFQFLPPKIAPTILKVEPDGTLSRPPRLTAKDGTIVVQTVASWFVLKLGNDDGLIVGIYRSPRRPMPKLKPLN